MNLSPDSKFFNFMSKLGDFVVLNLLFIITCIPVFTIGTSLCALYTVCKKRLADEESYIIRGYLAIWKENFKNATIIWLFFLIWLPILLFLANFAAKHLNNIALFSCCLLLILWYIFTILYAFSAGQLYQYTIPHYLQQFPDRYGTPAVYAGTVRSNIPARRHHLDVSRDIVLYLYLLGSHRFSLGGIFSVLITERVFRHYRPKETE